MRTTLLIVTGFFVIAGSGFFLLMRTIRKDVERQYSQASEEPLVDFAYLYAGMLEQEIEAGRISVTKLRAGVKGAKEREFLAKIYQIEKRDIPTQIYVTNAEGIVIFDSEGYREGEDYSQYNDVFLARAGKYGVRATRTDPEDPRTTVFYVAAPVYDGEEMIGTLTVARPETAMAPFVEESKGLILRSSIIVAVVVVLQGMLWAYWILRPVGDLTKHARQIADGEESRMPITGVAELRDLSIALEDMRRELEGKHYVENYVQALTHELKSPLAAIRGAAELIDESMPEEKRRRFLDNILKETSRSEEMVRRLVQLASVESQTSLGKTETVDLPTLVNEELIGLNSVLENKKIDLSTVGFDRVFNLEGDPLMLRIAIRNVLNNAFDFTPKGGAVEVGFRKDGKMDIFYVRDSGPGIPDFAEGRVFDRFYSLKNEVTGRKGSGIGLSFVKATVELHGGTADLQNRAEGGAEMLLVWEV